MSSTFSSPFATKATYTNDMNPHIPPVPSTQNGGTPQHVPPRETERAKAKREARECIEALRYEGFQLDGFNLLSVVANPRAGMMSASRHNTNTPGTPTRPSDRIDAPTNAAASPPGAAPTTASGGTESSLPQTPAQAPSSDSGMFSEAVHSLESTLGQVTKQIEQLNLFLEELSRQYLGDDAGESMFLEYYYQDEDNQMEIPAIPAELANLQLDDLKEYLEKCGVLAHSLFALGIDTHSLPPTDTVASTANGSTSILSSNFPIVDPTIPDIPEQFAREDFDLTDSSTFVQFLLKDGTLDATTTNGGATNTPTDKSNSLYQPTYELVPVRDQDALASHLDSVELALQEQVRIKAEAFFHETTRFRQLGSSIHELLEQVQTLRRDVQSILKVYSDTKDISNHQLQDYEVLVELLDSAMELIQTKASVGGLLSANDQLGAAQQIQHGRRLLSGIAPNRNGAATSSEGSTQPNGPLELRQLVALSTCGEQFQQYESLVVQNLSEEMVEVFFHWHTGEREHVQGMVQALNLCHALPKAGELYQRRLQETVRMTVRTTIAEFVESSKSSGSGVTGMTYTDFFNCLELLIEELQTVLTMARQVDEFCVEDAIFAESEKRWTKDALASGADLAAKSIEELLRLRKEAHSLISLDEMRQLWDTCLQFTLVVEGYSNDNKAVSLRSTLLGQAKAYLSRAHESNMSGLVAALESERWTPCGVSTERQAALTRLCTGRVAMSARHPRNDSTDESNTNQEKSPIAEVEGVEYKVVWSCLLLVEMVMMNLSAAVHFRSLAANVVAKIAELLRLFNTRATQLVLGAGAIHSAARLKSINAKHLSMVTQCLGMITSLLPHIRAALMNQLPERQHTLLNDLDAIRREYTDHNERVLNKFVTIIGGIVEHALAPRIANTDFDARARDLSSTNEENEIECCAFLDGVSTNTRKLHQVLNAMLPPDHLQDVFSRIFAYMDQKVPTMLIAATSTDTAGNSAFSFPSTDEGKRRLILELECMTKVLNGLKGVLPWDFTCVNVLERKLDYKLHQPMQVDQPNESENATTNDEVTQKDEPAIVAVKDDSPPLSDEQTALATNSVDQVNDNDTEASNSADPIPTNNGVEDEDKEGSDATPPDTQAANSANPIPANDEVKDEDKEEFVATPMDTQATNSADPISAKNEVDDEDKEGSDATPPDTQATNSADPIPTKNEAEDEVEEESDATPMDTQAANATDPIPTENGVEDEGKEESDATPPDTQTANSADPIPTENGVEAVEKEESDVTPTDA